MTSKRTHPDHLLAPRPRAIQQLRNWIQQGRLAPGDALPAERALSDELGIARGTLRSALDELTAEGLLHEAGGRRRRVAERKHHLLAGTVALVSPCSAPAEQTPMGQDLFIQLAVARTLESAGLHVLTVSPPRFADGVWQQLVQEHAAGVLAGYEEMADPHVRAALESCSAAGLPVAAYDECGSACGFDTVSSDQAAGGADLTRWMLDHGRRRLLCFQRFPSRRAWMEGRWSGHRRAMAEAGLPPGPLVITPEITQPADSAEGFSAVARLLAGFLMESARGPRPIDGILASTDEHAYQVAGACRLLGLIPGSDVLIAGYDHMTHRCSEARHEPAGLAVTVDKDTPTIAARMADMLLERRSAQRLIAPRQVVVPHRVVAVLPLTP